MQVNKIYYHNHLGTRVLGQRWFGPHIWEDEIFKLSYTHGGAYYNQYGNGITEKLNILKPY